jgi:hypothetical protein
MSLTLNRRRPRFLALLAPLTALAGVAAFTSFHAIGCGGTDVIDDRVDAADSMIPDTLVDDTADTSVAPDTSVDALDALDAPDAFDAADGSDADAHDAPDVLDSSKPDSADAADTAPDVADAFDAFDAFDALDAADSADARPDVLDALDTGSGSLVPSLGAAAIFSVLGGSTVTSTGLSTVTGDLGVWPGLAVTGFPPGVVIAGSIDRGGPTSAAGQASLTVLYDALMGAACNTDMTSIDLSGKTLGPGVYCFSSSAAISTVGTLTLDAKGDPNAFWIFQIGSTLTTPDTSAVNVINGGTACNVFWQVGASATIGKSTAFGGNIVAFSSITLMTGASLSGRALARNGAVTLDANAVAFSTCK